LVVILSAVLLVTLGRFVFRKRDRI